MSRRRTSALFIESTAGDGACTASSAAVCRPQPAVGVSCSSPARRGACSRPDSRARSYELLDSDQKSLLCIAASHCLPRCGDDVRRHCEIGPGSLKLTAWRERRFREGACRLTVRILSPAARPSLRSSFPKVGPWDFLRAIHPARRQAACNGSDFKLRLSP